MRARLGGVMGAKGSCVACCLLLASTLLTGCNKTSATGPSDAAATAPASAASTASAIPATSNTAQPPVSTSKSVDVTWTAPTANTDGSALTNLAGYTIYYGTSPSKLTQSIDVQDAGATDQVVRGLADGTWYFAVAAYTNMGLRSSYSSVVSKTIT